MNENGRKIVSKVFMSKEELFEENIEYVPYIEEDDLISNEVAPNNLSEWEENVEPPSTVCRATSTSKPIVVNVIELYQCTLCAYTNQSIDEFVQHFKTHASPKPEPPKLAPPVAVVDAPATEPDDSNNQEMFLCGQCSAIFSTMDQCRDHMIKDHKFQEIPENKSEDESMNEPPDDYNDFEYLDDEDDEQTEMTNDNETWVKPVSLRELKARLLKTFIYKCPLKGCFYKFETIEKRDKHIECHTSQEFDKVRDFKCYECGEESERWRHNAKHMWDSHKIDIDLLRCPLCDYKSVTSVQIFRHIQIHSTVKGFVCPECSKVFSQAAQLRLHSVLHLSDNTKSSGPVRWYSKKTCQICNRIFSTSKTLSKHIKAVHNKIKPFICSVCGYKAARKASLTVHMRQHTGAKPLKCRYCKFSARDPSGLVKHEIGHSTKTAYLCKYCSYRSAQSNGLKKHFQLVHPDEFKAKMSCDICKFNSINEEILTKHKEDHKLGLIENDDSSNTVDSSSPNKNVLKRLQSTLEKPTTNVEISSDCFLPIESTDSINHDPPVDTGGVTIPASHSEDTQFPSFVSS